MNIMATSTINKIILADDLYVESVILGTSCRGRRKAHYKVNKTNSAQKMFVHQEDEDKIVSSPHQRQW